MVEHPSLNSAGLPPVWLTEEQRYIFDTKGWVCIPGILDEFAVAEMRQHCLQLVNEKDSICEPHRSSIGGPLEQLIDHPAVLGFMNEFVAHDSVASEQGYGFRLEGSFLAHRKLASTNFSPHGGSGIFQAPGNSHTYSCWPGKVNSGLTRCVWELNPVKAFSGGTLFLSGSHKAAFEMPSSALNENSRLWESYKCPAGSVLFFTEAITHTGATWTDDEHERIAVFNCYNTINAKWHNWEPNPRHVAMMSQLRQSLFRGVYCDANDLRELAS